MSQPIRPAAVFFWVTIQLATLTIGATATPLWAHHPRPGESIAADEMIVVQIAAAAMLFPFLLANFSTTLANILLAWPFLQLAGWLSATPGTNLLWTSLLLSLWIAGLGCCAAIMSAKEKSVALCAASMWTLGGVVLWYLHCEATDSSAARMSERYFGPVLCGLAQLHRENICWAAWLTASVPMLVAVIWRAMKKNFKTM